MWKVSEYSKKQINEAGKKIIDPNASEAEVREARIIIDNWRAAHAFPMNTFAIQLRRRTKGIKDAVVVQRIKRLESIVGKLKRKPTMKLYRMQDLGGCRVILPKIDDVYAIVNSIRNSRIRHYEMPPKDYIAIPNCETGYRSYHMRYQYKSEKNTKYNGMMVELQIRTKLQHLWATAVETVGLFTQNGLKFNEGDEKWLHFFKIVSGFFALEEKTAIPDGLPSNVSELLAEYYETEEELEALLKLMTIGLVARRVGHITKDNTPGYYLIILKIIEKDNAKIEININIEKFSGMEKGLDRATKRYNDVEATSDKSTTNAVLVSAQSYETLVYAYPNYFADIAAFTKTLRKIVDKYRNLVNDKTTNDSINAV